MQNVTAIRDNVFFSQTGKRDVNQIDIDFLMSVAEQHPQKRARLCLHAAPEYSIQEMIIAFSKNAYTSPIRQDKNEFVTYLAVEGTADVIIYDDLGDIVEIKRLGLQPPSNRVIRLPRFKCRSMYALDSRFVFYEVNPGPFFDSDTEIPPWYTEELDGMAEENSKLKYYNFKLRGVCSLESCSIAEEHNFSEVYREAMRPHIEAAYPWNETLQSKKIKDMCSNDLYRINLDGHFIGYIRFWLRDGKYYLDNIQIASAYRSKGIGEKIINNLFDFYLELQVFKSSPAVRFYERLGFLKYGETKNHYLLRR